MMDDMVQRAKELAHRAHAGQVDKAGRPYIEHVARVAAAVRIDKLCHVDDCENGMPTDWRAACGNPECCPWRKRCEVCEAAEAVAWLHDVVEDAPGFVGELPAFPARIKHSVIALTKYPGFKERTYFHSIRNNPIALRVKLADIADNADESRLALLDPKTADRLRKKYAKARRALTEE
jgi:(p)ppGpp synthase/HD superfamily hydrolase